MSRHVLACLVVAALLTAGVVPQNVYADGDEINREDDEAWLSAEETAFVASVRERAGSIRDCLSRLRGLVANPEVLDEGWSSEIGWWAVGTAGWGCSLPSAPASMQDISALWQELVCTKLESLCELTNKGRPEYGDIGGVVLWLDSIRGLVEGVEAGIVVVELALINEIARIADARREAERVRAGGGINCFIATAAYGTPAAEEIDILRQFRDEFLQDNAVGRAFVDFYYEASPPIADFISEHEILRTVVREGFVDPVVNVVEITRDSWAK